MFTAFASVGDKKVPQCIVDLHNKDITGKHRKECIRELHRVYKLRKPAWDYRESLVSEPILKHRRREHAIMLKRYDLKAAIFIREFLDHSRKLKKANPFPTYALVDLVLQKVISERPPVCCEVLVGISKDEHKCHRSTECNAVESCTCTLCRCPMCRVDRARDGRRRCCWWCSKHVDDAVELF